MTAKSLASVALTADAFRPFGAVLMAFGPAPERYAYAGNIENRRDQAKANLTFIHAPAKPALIGAVERHAFSSQTFVPMNGVRYLVGVCPPTADGGPDVERLIAFIADGGQAVNYDAGVWHSPLCVLDRAGEFVMLRFDDGGPLDTELVKLETPVEVRID